MATRWSLKLMRTPSVRLLVRALGPIPGLIASAILQGVAKAMQPLLWGMLACAAWVAGWLWPSASYVATWIVNRPYLGYMRRRESRLISATEHQARLENSRSRVFNGMRSIVWAAFALVVLCAFGLSVHAIIQQHIAEEKADIAGHLNLSYSMPFNNSPKNGAFTFSNDSAEDIRLLYVECGIKRALMSSNAIRVITREGGFNAVRLNVVLRAGGDHQSISCPDTPNIVHFGSYVSVICADVVISVFYNSADFGDVQQKSYRYMTGPNLNTWVPVALNDPYPYCKDEMK